MISNNIGTGLRAAIPWVEKAIYDALRGELPRHIVNEDVIPRWLERFGGKSLI